MAEPDRSRQFVASGFFALRTPLLPLEELLRWGDGLEAPTAVENRDALSRAAASDRRVLRDRLKVLVSQPEIREALFVASPDLVSSLETWFQEPDTERGRRIERAVVKYFCRMVGRATPFGLFAGCSVGRIGSHTALTLEGRETYQRHTRLDAYFLSALADSLGLDPELRKSLLYRPNSSLYRAAGRWRYAEARSLDNVRTFHLVAIDPTDYLETALTRAEQGARRDALVSALTESDPEIARDEAERYVDELIDNQVLVADLGPCVTGPEPVLEMAGRFEAYPEAAAKAERLRHASEALVALDSAGLGVSPERYKAIAATLEDLPAKVELPRLFQVDLAKPAPCSVLGTEIVAEILRGAEILRRLSGARRTDPFETFRESFIARYEGREVPLVEALDEEAGIGFAQSRSPGAETSPLLAGLDFPGATQEVVNWEARHTLLLRKLEEARASGAHEIVLSEGDLESMSSSESPPWGDAISIAAALVASSAEAAAKGDLRIVLGGFSGPSGARLLGRFCHGDAELRRQVDRHLRDEEALDPEALFAEVVHLPQGRLGNVLCRPVLRDYEIPFLGLSGAPKERQIPITDLLVSVAAGRVVLRSGRLQRRVIPRLTSAHNYTMGNQGLYRFLCALQSQGVIEGSGWSWGPLRGARFLPRVVTGKLILSLARWVLDLQALRALDKAKGTAGFELVQRWRREGGMPRFVSLADGDHLLPADLDNVLSVEALIDLIAKRSQAVLVELFPEPDMPCAQGPEGRFIHELVVPFVRRGEPAPGVARRQPAHAGDIARNFLPGSEWLYAKIYTGTSTADRILREIVRPLIREATGSGAVGTWFFLRYSDPEWHVRLRLHSDPRKLREEVLPALQQATAPLLQDGSVWRVQLETYQREVERYGGPEGVALSELIFHVDSEAVIEILDQLSGDEGADARWRLALRGIDLLLEDLGFDRAAKRLFVRSAYDALSREFRVDKDLRIQLGSRHRKERASLEALLDPAGARGSAILPALEILGRRSDRMAPLVTELKRIESRGGLSQPIEELAGSYVHMHVNRMLRSAQRPQELVLYDFLARCYESSAARRR